VGFHTSPEVVEEGVALEVETLGWMAGEEVFGTGTTITVLKVVTFGCAETLVVGVGRITAIEVKVVG
jgi:hypothetical protein